MAEQTTELPNQFVSWKDLYDECIQKYGDRFFNMSNIEVRDEPVINSRAINFDARHDMYGIASQEIKIYNLSAKTIIKKAFEYMEATALKPKNPEYLIRELRHSLSSIQTGTNAFNIIDDYLLQLDKYRRLKRDEDERRPF